MVVACLHNIPTRVKDMTAGVCSYRSMMHANACDTSATDLRLGLAGCFGPCLAIAAVALAGLACFLLE